MRSRATAYYNESATVDQGSPSRTIRLLHSQQTIIEIAMLSTFLHRRWRTYGTLVFACCSYSLCPALSPAQELARRLILKDGSYQLVTKYEIKGNRVRYLSAERNDWEELPESLVDWPATEKYEKDRAAGASVPEAAQLDKELEHERDREETQLPQVAPGLRLPEDSGVFLLDSFQGEPQIVEIQQTAGDINRNTKANIFRGAINPVAGLKQTIELEGAHAPMQAHVDVPSLYIKIGRDPQRAPARPPARKIPLRLPKHEPCATTHSQSATVSRPFSNCSHRSERRKANPRRHEAPGHRQSQPGAAAGQNHHHSRQRRLAETHSDRESCARRIRARRNGEAGRKSGQRRHEPLRLGFRRKSQSPCQRQSLEARSCRRSTPPSPPKLRQCETGNNKQ